MPEGAEASVLHSRTKRGDQWDAPDLESCSHVRRTGWGDCRRRINSDFAVFYEWLRLWVHLPLGSWTSAPQDAMTSYLVFALEARESYNVVTYNGRSRRRT